MASIRALAVLFLIVSLSFVQDFVSAGRKILQDSDEVDTVRLNARSVEEAAALARAGIRVRPGALEYAPAPGYEDARAPSQAPMPSPAPDAIVEIPVGSPVVGPAADAITAAPDSDSDDLAAMVVGLPLYSDGYGL